MGSIAQHVTMRLQDSRTIVKSPPERRQAARAILGIDEAFQLIAFRCADSHIHSLVPGPRSQAAEFARRAKLRLSHGLRLDVPFDPTRFRPIESQHHLSNAFRYVFTQEQHHGTDCDPTFDASNLPDLLGMRLVGAHTQQNVETFLPRVTRHELVDYFGGDPTDGPLTLEVLSDAAAAALALPSLEGQRRTVVDARCGAARVGLRIYTAAELADALSVTRQCIQKLRWRNVSPALLDAVELQWRLRSTLLAQRRDTTRLALQPDQQQSREEARFAAV